MVEGLSLSRIILELTQNAIDAKCTAIDIVIKVTTYETNLYEIQIKDNGIITGEVDKFFDSGYTTKGSLGIGLSLVKEYARKNDGEVRVNRLNDITTINLKFKTNDVLSLDHFDEILYTLSCNYELKFKYIYNYEFNYNTRKIKNILKDVSIKEFRVMNYLKEYIREGLKINYNK